jgi:integrase
VAEVRASVALQFHHGGREHRYSLDKIAQARHERPPTSKSDAARWRDRLMRRAEVLAAEGATVRLEQKPIDAISKADVEAVRAWRRQQQTAGHTRAGEKAGEVGINRLLSRMRHVFTWAVVEGHCDTTPFRRGPVAVVKLNARAEGARTRRLAPGEEADLLKHANPHLRALIVAALSTGCRIGELLSLQWQQIRYDDKGDARWLVLPSEKTKTAEARVLPIGPRLRGNSA